MAKSFVEVTPHKSIKDSDVVEFITDVEGNFEYFESIISKSKALRWSDDKQLLLNEGHYLVHGGDAVDKGSGDIRVIRALTSLKRRYPDRVFLILGNRDCNKLRYGSELAEGETGESDPEGICYWDAKHKPYTTWLEGKGDAKGPMSTLKWMLECTMGCPTTFESRRTEIGILEKKPRDQISDQDVFDNMVASVDPKGSDPWMLEYIKLGQLALILGDSLFVHGGLKADALGSVPGSEVVHTNLRDWCDALAEFHGEQVQAYLSNPRWVGAGTQSKRTRGHHLLLDYGVPGGNGGKTVIYTDMKMHGSREETRVEDTEVDDYLVRAGVNRLFVGHAPQGDCPKFIRASSGVEIFACDTSYSDMSKANDQIAPDNRGKAISMVWIASDGTTVDGVLSNGQNHSYWVPVNISRSESESVIGREVDGGFNVRTVREDKSVVAYRFEGFKRIEKEWASEAEVPEDTRPKSEENSFSFVFLFGLLVANWALVYYFYFR